MAAGRPGVRQRLVDRARDAVAGVAARTAERDEQGLRLVGEGDAIDHRGAEAAGTHAVSTGVRVARPGGGGEPDRIRAGPDRLPPVVSGRIQCDTPTMRRLVLLFLSVVLLALPAAAPARGPLVLAAASLQEVMDDAADAWAAQGHAHPVISFAASSALARQIAAGAPADLFVAADVAWMDDVARRGRLVRGTRADLATNRLVVVARPGGRAVATTRGAALAKILAAGPLAMADAAVPAGRYGEEALRRMGAWTAVAPHVVRAENVRAALALVERGAAPYGIVYATDARAAPALRLAGVFPPRSHAPIVYPIARLAGSTDPDAEGFRRFLLSPAGRAILRRRGFGTR
jgi:molybdate transport system substrate-binding protein